MIAQFVNAARRSSACWQASGAALKAQTCGAFEPQRPALAASSGHPYFGSRLFSVAAGSNKGLQVVVEPLPDADEGISVLSLDR